MDIIIYQPFVNEIKELIQRKQFQAIKMINTETVNLYWEIGEEIYRQQREKGQGKSIVQILAKELQKEFPGTQGYSAANLWRMRNFYLTYCNSEKLAPLVREISWSNNMAIMEKCKDDLQREFYVQMTKRFDLTLPEERRIQAKLAVKDEYTFDFAVGKPYQSFFEAE